MVLSYLNSAFSAAAAKTGSEEGSAMFANAYNDILARLLSPVVNPAIAFAASLLRLSPKASTTESFAAPFALANPLNKAAFEALELILTNALAAGSASCASVK
ncbi:hypothetical protein D3C86_935100 [compost metagenome]